MDLSEGQLYSAPPCLPSPPKLCLVVSIAFMILTAGAQIAASRRTIDLWSLA